MTISMTEWIIWSVSLHHRSFQIMGQWTSVEIHINPILNSSEGNRLCLSFHNCPSQSLTGNLFKSIMHFEFSKPYITLKTEGETSIFFLSVMICRINPDIAYSMLRWWMWHIDLIYCALLSHRCHLDVILCIQHTWFTFMMQICWCLVRCWYCTIGNIATIYPDRTTRCKYICNSQCIVVWLYVYIYIYVNIAGLGKGLRCTYTFFFQTQTLCHNVCC